ncbi:MAG: hypothetical protein U5K30_05835 [Acidimicrobiales bacterium]|nr:hypothetical protein [Acidimicrobiales bacterium]
MRTRAMLSTFGLIVGAVVTVWGVPAMAATITGGDKGGADITVADGDVLSGAFTNVGTFTVPAGVTAQIEQGTPFSLEAEEIVIDGTIDGSGAGQAGGPTSAGTGVDGTAGSGPGAGGGGTHGPCVHSGGGGGGGYGGVGGMGSTDSANGGEDFGGAGGPTYGTESGTDIAPGSGGGSGGNHCSSYDNTDGGAGGNGGASISLTGTVRLNGSILADGADGEDGATDPDFGTPGGGGGSGGGVQLDGTLYLEGTISASGGDGGDAGPGQFAQGGGAGGGGRVKITGAADTGAGFTMDVAGGAAGVGTGDDTGAEAGGEGTTHVDVADIVEDAEGPVAQDVVAEDGEVTATVTDVGTGDSDLVGAMLVVGDQEVEMDAVDGAFDSPTEDVSGSYDPPEGDHEVCIVAEDAVGNTTETCVEVLAEVTTSAPAPAEPTEPAAPATPVEAQPTFTG